MKIIKAVLKDLKVILDLNRTLFKYERKYSTTYNINWTNSKKGTDYFRNRIESPSGIVFVAKLRNEVIGYICLHFNNYGFRCINPIGEIENMIIKREYRGKGVGTLLVKEVLKCARKKGVKRFKVETLMKNKDAIRFYRKLGFKNFKLVLEC